MFDSRVTKLREGMPQGMDAVYLTGEVSRTYFSGIKTSAGSILITKKNAYFFADFRYIERVRGSVRHMLPVPLGGEITLEDIFFAEGINTVGFEDLTTTVAELETLKTKYPDTEFLPLGDTVIRLRAIKDRSEVMTIMQAQSITDKAFVAALDFIAEGKSEKEVRDFLESEMKKNGADGPAFPTIVLAGPKTSMPHGVPTDRKIKKGEFVLMDFGAEVANYRSDMTRTVAVGGVSDEMRKVYQTVLKAQKLALEAVKPGVVASEIDRIARDYIEGEGYVGCFGHGFGHSLGLEVHEFPSFSANCKELLQPDMVITAEPGIYLEGSFGVRIEDMILIDQENYENLTYSPKELIIL